MKLNRNIVLGIGSFILMLLGLGTYTAASQGYATWQQYQRAQQQLDDIQHAPQVLAQQQERLLAMKQQAGSLQAESISIDDLVDLSQYLDKLCETYRLRLVSLPRTLSGQQESEQFSIATTAFSLEGELDALLQALYQIEHTDQVGTIPRLKLGVASYFERGKEQHELIADIRLQRMMSQ